MGQNQESKRAVVVAVDGRVQISSGICSPMIPLVDRPFLQHVVESLVDNGIRQVDFLLHEHAGNIEAHFGDGERWGIDLRYHLVRDPQIAYQRLRSLNLDRPFLLARGELLQPAEWGKLLSETPESPVLFCWSECDSSTSWAGSAWITPELLKQLPTDASDPTFELMMQDQIQETGRLVDVPEPLSAATFQGLIQSQSRVLNREFPELVRFKGGGEGNVWVGRNVYMKIRNDHFKAPFYIGANSTIEGDSKIGPNVVIMDGAYINDKCEIRNALIMPNSLIGEGLVIDQCIIDRHQLFHTDHDVAFSVDDTLLIGSFQVPFLGEAPVRKAFSKLAALLTLTLFSPILLLIFLLQKIRYGNAFRCDEVLKLPTADRKSRLDTFNRFRFMNQLGTNKSNWRHFWLDFLPGLLNVIRGEMGWVGVTPLAADEIELLPDDLREKYFLCQAGLINESTVVSGQHGSVEDRMMAEIYYIVSVTTFLERIKRIGSYFLSIFKGPQSQPNGFSMGIGFAKANMHGNA